ncbi:CHASE2 domain-containing sensor protein [Staphylococcus hominis]
MKIILSFINKLVMIMMKFLIKLLLISLISFLSGWLLGIHVAFAIYMLGSVIAALNIEKNGGVVNEH